MYTIEHLSSVIYHTVFSRLRHGTATKRMSRNNTSVLRSDPNRISNKHSFQTSCHLPHCPVYFKEVAFTAKFIPGDIKDSILYGNDTSCIIMAHTKEGQ